MRALRAGMWIVLVCMGWGAFAMAQESPAARRRAEAEKNMSGSQLYERKFCGDCHGEDGHTPRFDYVPSIAGQSPRYLLSALLEYKSGERKGKKAGEHAQVNGWLNEEQMGRIAEYVATMK